MFRCFVLATDGAICCIWRLTGPRWWISIIFSKIKVCIVLQRNIFLIIFHRECLNSKYSLCFRLYILACVLIKPVPIWEIWLNKVYNNMQPVLRPGEVGKQNGCQPDQNCLPNKYPSGSGKVVPTFNKAENLLGGHFWANFLCSPVHILSICLYHGHLPARYLLVCPPTS